MMMKSAILTTCLALFLAPTFCRENSNPTVYVLLWFDTEDYLLPASDDAALRLSRFLTDQGIRATFKVVGEKARVLEDRGRTDVLSALTKHEIGYHTNFHSVEPTPAVYLSRLGWHEGVAEFDRRERQGFLDVARITGQVPSCYGQPGSSWAPQQFGALRQWGVSVYLDAGQHVSLNGKPFWYCGILNLYALEHTLRTGLDQEQDLTLARMEFDSAYEALLREGGGVVSIYYHSCEFVHRQFWDAVNFSGGANPPRSAWKIPPARTALETELAHHNFEAYIRHIQSHAGVRFITAREALDLYSDDARQRIFSVQEMARLARRLQSGEINHQVLGDITLAPAEQFFLLTQFTLQSLGGQPIAGPQLAMAPLGPIRPAPVHREITATASQFQRTIADVAQYLQQQRQVPDVVWLGSDAVSPESYLVTLAGAALCLAEGRPFQESVRFRPATLASAQRVRNDRDLWSWTIFPSGFEAPEMMELARRQAWTLKPALLPTLLPPETSSGSGGNSGEEVWIQLFNGQDLDGWDVKIKGYDLNDNFGDTFQVEKGVLKVSYDQYESFEGRFGHLFYAKNFSHYRLRVEYRFVGDQVVGGPGWGFRNSGIMVHSQSARSMKKNQDFPISIEAQLLGGADTPGRTNLNFCTPGTHMEIDGRLFTDHCLSSSSKAPQGDRWVTVEVEVLGDSSIQLFHEGVMVLSCRRPQIGGGVVHNYEESVKVDGQLLREGFISLQGESHPIEFREVELLNLKGCMDPTASNYKTYYVESDASHCRFTG